MIRIDAHTHIFDTIAGFGHRGELRGIGGGRARWANGDEIALIPPELGDRSFEADTLARLLKENGVDKAILLQGSFYGYNNEYIWQAAQDNPERFVPAATVDPFCKQAGAMLTRFLQELRFPVVKFELSSGGGLMGYHPDFAIAGPTLAGLIRQVADAGAVLVLDIGSPGMGSFQPENVAELAKRHPKMHIVLCHMLAPTPGDEAPLEQALRVLRLENIWFDLSAMPWNVFPETYPYPTAQNFLSIAKNTVGAKKLLWGSDVPSTLTRESYRRQMDWVTDSGLFSASETEGVMGANALAAFKL